MIKIKKSISTRIVVVLLIIIFLVIVGAYYMGSIRERLSPSRLGIMPEIIQNATTTTPTIPTTTTKGFGIRLFDCISDGDCSDQTKCDENLYYHTTGRCGSDNICSYGNWTVGTCTQSVNNCDAECDTGGCPPGSSCDLSNCRCLEPE